MTRDTVAVGPVAWTPGAACPRSAEITALVLFGATGDLTRRKLMPAVYSLMADGLLPCGLPTVCIGRRLETRDQLLDELKQGVRDHARRKPLQPEIWDAMAHSVQYVRGELNDINTYQKVAAILRGFDQTGHGPLNHLFYLAVPPHYFEPVLDNLDASGLAAESQGHSDWPRIVIEKPFGRDLASAQRLNGRVRTLFDEQQVFRMDHYLGKETVQNLLVLRFANGIFEPIWNQNYIANVQVTMAETVGVEGRGQYFDKSGMLRDVVQNHLLELLALVAMEPPATMDPEAVRDEKSKLLRAVRRLTPQEAAHCTVRARYTEGRIDGEPVPGYREEPGVDPASEMETYAAVRLGIDNWRWAGVPFLVRAGKRLGSRVTQIAVRFKQAPHLVFQGEERNIEPNTLFLRIQPNEGVHLCFSAKQPGPGLHIQPVTMAFHFADAFKVEPPEAYERLILDALLGNKTLFARADGIEASWSIMDPILEAWESGAPPVATYAAGAWGPQEADGIAHAANDEWQDPTVGPPCGPG